MEIALRRVRPPRYDSTYPGRPGSWTFFVSDPVPRCVLDRLEGKVGLDIGGAQPPAGLEEAERVVIPGRHRRQVCSVDVEAWLSFGSTSIFAAASHDDAQSFRAEEFAARSADSFSRRFLGISVPSGFVRRSTPARPRVRGGQKSVELSFWDGHDHQSDRMPVQCQRYPVIAPLSETAEMKPPGARRFGRSSWT